MTSMVDYAIFKYDLSNNLGDEVQSLAAKQHLPRVDHYVERDDYDQVALKRRTKIIANGWYSHRDDTWPPKSEFLDPLFVALHIAPCSEAIFTTPEMIDYFKSKQPIGCRDMHTKQLLESYGVKAWFSGCLTLTLPKLDVEKTNDILFVDMPLPSHGLIPNDLKDQQVIMTNLYSPLDELCAKVHRRTAWPYFYRKTLNSAEALLRRFASAKLVVTTRLHCAMPCLAMGVPVYFAVHDVNDTRYEGLAENCKFLDMQAFLKNPDMIDWSMSENPGDITSIQNNLKTAVRAYLDEDKRLSF